MRRLTSEERATINIARWNQYMYLKKKHKRNPFVKKVVVNKEYDASGHEGYAKPYLEYTAFYEWMKKNGWKTVTAILTCIGLYISHLALT